MKKAWNDLVLYSTGIAALLIITLVSVALLMVVGVAVIFAKLAVFVK